MKSLKRICTILIVLAIFFPLDFALAQDQTKEKPWSGTLKDGTKINREDLKGILADHKKWLDTEGKEGKRAQLSGANLQEADLQDANLQKADLSEADLQKANLQGADLLEANLWGANLQEADLFGANLQKAYLQWANLQKANLWGANLQKANLQGANLQKANLWGANLQKAYLQGADLQEAYLMGADLGGSIFELKPNGLPYIPSIAKAESLSSLRYSELSHSLVELRAAFKKSGLRKQEREVTYAIKHSGFINAKTKGNLLTKIEVYLGWFFFELTCKWGMAPERPLFILVGLIFMFTIPYAHAISGDIYGKKKTDGIWRVWIPGRMRKDFGEEAPEELLDDISPKCLMYGFYFSVLSAFHVGWRDLNVGNWIARMQPYEYRLQATGWARTISGIQSLISVYLLALSVLTYFGRPFESY